MAAQNNPAPIIIKRKKVVGGGGHHGGAWKVAYADFVTAMMAFFMLMWLLNATTEQQRAGIADYFTPTIPINRSSGGGDGAFGGDSTFAEETLPKNGTGASLEYATDHQNARGDSGADDSAEGRAAEDEQFTEIDKTLQGRGGESLVMENALKHVNTRTTDEGMVIELFDIEGSPLFNERTGKPEPVLRELIATITEASKIVVNKIAVEAHVRAAPIVRAQNPVWENSAQRATEARLLLELFNVAPARIKRVTGYADREPVVKDPMAVRNNRLEIILLREGK